jgi:Fuc2NAc and GlcNAc transferase
MYSLILVFLASVLLTGVLRLLLVKQGALDIPNARSLHAIPVPRGGGLSIVIVFLAVIWWFAHVHFMPASLAWALEGGGAMIAVVGLLDDYFRVSVWRRLLVQFAASGWALWWLRGVDPLHWYRADPILMGLTQILGAILLVWFTNLYNFMDGIDGLAGTEAVCVSGLSGVLLLRGGLDGSAHGAWMLGAASGGFLVWNWPPARIFMGDVGSAFIGFVLGVFAISSTNILPRLLWPWLILLAVFFVDSTITLVWRVITGAPWHEGHCTHAYQHAARRLGSHWKVTLTVAGVNLIWLFPLAWIAASRPETGALLCAIAIVPLVCTAVCLRAGRPSYTSITANRDTASAS